MARFHLTQAIDAPVGSVWRELADLAAHAEWMADADTITFTSDRREGVGTTFDCVTRIGPLRTVDRMEVTRWEEGRAMAVRHVGLVRGEGTFTLRPLGDGGGGGGGGGDARTAVDWDEDLRFPWWLGGPLAGLAAGPVLRLVWRGNLRRFAARVTPKS